MRGLALRGPHLPPCQLPLTDPEFEVVERMLVDLLYALGQGEREVGQGTQVPPLVLTLLRQTGEGMSFAVATVNSPAGGGGACSTSGPHPHFPWKEPTRCVSPRMLESPVSGTRATGRFFGERNACGSSQLFSTPALVYLGRCILNA